MRMSDGGGSGGEFLCALVGRAEEVCAEYVREGCDGVAEIARRIPRQLGELRAGEKRTFSHGAYLFHVLASVPLAGAAGSINGDAPRGGACVYALAVVPSAFSGVTAFAYLADVLERFRAFRAPLRLDTLAPDYGAFSVVLKQQALYYAHDPRAETIRVAREHAARTTAVMRENIDLAVQRGVQIEDLEDKTTVVLSDARRYRRQTRTLKRTACRNTCCTRCVALAITLVIVLLLAAAAAVVLLLRFYHPHRRESTSSSL